MSEWQVHLELEEGTSSKFWRAKIEGKTLHVNYGRIGATGLTQVKDFASPDGARQELDKLVKDKRNKGYADAGEDHDGDGDEDGEDDDDDGGGDDVDDVDDADRDGDGDGDGDGITLVLAARGRNAETRLVLDGSTVRMDVLETFASPGAASKAFDRLKQALIGDGYMES